MPPSEQLVVGIGDRAPAARGRRGRARGARRDEPSHRVHQPVLSRHDRVAASPLRGVATRRLSSNVVAPEAVVVSFRLGGADGVAVEARKWAWALGELGFEVRRVAGAIEDDGQPDDIVLPGLAIDPPAGAADRRRGRGARARRRRSRDRRQPLLAPAERRRRRTRSRAVAARAPRAGPASGITTFRGSAGTSRDLGESFPPPYRRRAARDDQPAQPARARSARLPRRRPRSTTSSTSIRRPGDRASDPRRSSVSATTSS